MRVKEEKLIEHVSIKDLPDGFQYVGEICGMDLAKQLMVLLGGMNIYIPKVTSEKIITPYIRKRFSALSESGLSKIKISQILVNETGLAYSTVKKLIKNCCKN
ncbi:hypothetical protein D9V86_11325 [Bacteroidetes/Chlorobi group bacterium ChocPot_Mid]|nr:MAG: hypothetical protein D9V86_11325 [Bacteroidetes/Chlorobi group bacterium ChocPot_Mid]